MLGFPPHVKTRLNIVQLFFYIYIYIYIYIFGYAGLPKHAYLRLCGQEAANNCLGLI